MGVLTGNPSAATFGALGLTGIPGEAMGYVANGQMASPTTSLSGLLGQAPGNSAPSPTFGARAMPALSASPAAPAAPTLGASAPTFGGGSLGSTAPSALSSGQSGGINWQQLINSLMQKMGATTGGTYSSMGFGGNSGMYGI